MSLLLPVVHIVIACLVDIKQSKPYPDHDVPYMRIHKLHLATLVNLLAAFKLMKEESINDWSTYKDND